MNEQINKFMKPSVLLPLGAAVISFGGGLAVGYFLGRKAKKVIFVPNETELAKIRTDLDEIRAKREARNSESQDKKVGDVEEDGSKIIAIIEPEDRASFDISSVVSRNVFAENSEDWDYDKEKQSRDSTAPYIIHVDEFASNEMDYEQVTLTYYKGDDTLTDVDSKPIYNKHEVVGDNLRFGHGSKDANIVYVRNEVRRTEFEVLYEEGLYSIEVLGLEADEDHLGPQRHIEHSAQRKFRPQE